MERKVMLQARRPRLAPPRYIMPSEGPLLVACGIGAALR